MRLENLVLKIIKDFPQGINQTQIIQYVLDSGYKEEIPGQLAFKVRKIVTDLVHQKLLVKHRDKNFLGRSVSFV